MVKKSIKKASWHNSFTTLDCHCRVKSGLIVVAKAKCSRCALREVMMSPPHSNGIMRLRAKDLMVVSPSSKEVNWWWKAGIFPQDVITWGISEDMPLRGILKTTVDVPRDLSGIIPDEIFSKARFYNLDSLTFGIIHSVFDNIFGTLLILLYIMPAIWKYSESIADKFDYSSSEIVVSIIFMLIMNTLNSFISLPFHVYSIFVIEEKHGFNKQTPIFFIKDTLKGYFLMQFLITVLTSPIIYIINAGGQYFFIYLWLFAVLFTLFFMTIYPEVIAPLFDKYTPLEEGDLRTGIEELAASVQFPLKKIYVVEGSKRSAHSNAYFYGFFKNKRIVLFDTLLMGYGSSDSKENEKTENSTDENSSLLSNQTEETEKKGCTNDEVLAVLAHELGHWKGNHVLKQLILSQLNELRLLIVLQFIFTPYHFILSFLMTLLTRKYEFEADAFAKNLGKAEFLRKSLIKLNKDNLGFPVYDWLYSMFNHSHPPLLERLKALNKTE
ncbi:hypothetical protein PGB90_002701 [Kerria lacca]